MVGRGKSDRSSSATEGKSDDLALRLTKLDVTCHEATVRKSSARENCVVVDIANLDVDVGSELAGLMYEPQR